MTFYVINIKHPFDSLATFPNFTLDEAADAIQHDKFFNEDCIPMTAEERKRFVTRCRHEDDYESIYNSMKNSFKYNQFLNGEIDSKLTYSFWITSAYDTYTTVFAVGADTVGDYEFNLTRVAKRLGEKHFNYFATSKGKRFKDFSTLVKTLDELGIKNYNFTKEDLIDACNEDKYFLLYK